MAVKKNRAKRATQGHIENYTDNTASRHDECGERYTDAFKGYWDLPYPRARMSTEGKPFIGDVFNPPDGDPIDEN